MHGDELHSNTRDDKRHEDEDEALEEGEIVEEDSVVDEIKRDPKHEIGGQTSTKKKVNDRGDDENDKDNDSSALSDLGELESEDEALVRPRARPRRPATTIVEEEEDVVSTQTIKALHHMVEMAEIPSTSSTSIGTTRRAPKATRSARFEGAELGLSESGDEYIQTEVDEESEKKVNLDGTLNDEREYRCRVFRIMGHGSKYFFLATEAARTLGYRDSYLLFQKNRTLRKLVTTELEKGDLIAQEIIPYSYRSRQIGVVSARSVFKCFGARIVVKGRRVRDDYWTQTARDAGYTGTEYADESDAPRGNANHGADERTHNPTLGFLPHKRGIGVGAGGGTGTRYGNGGSEGLDAGGDGWGNGTDGHGRNTHDSYHDATNSTDGVDHRWSAEQHAKSVAEFNKLLNSQRKERVAYFDTHFRKKHLPATL